MAETYTRWDVTEYLETAEDIRLYLEACAEEDPGEGSVIRAALDNIAKGRNLDALAREIGMSGEGLRKSLSEEAEPSFVSVMRVIRALGMELRIVPAKGTVVS